MLFGDWSSHCEQSEAQSLVLTSGGSAGVLPQREAGRAGGRLLGIRRARGDVRAFLKRAYSERGAVKNAAPRTDDLKCIGDLAESQRMRRSSNSFLIAVEVEGLFFFSSSTTLPRQWYEHFQPFPMLSLMIFGGFFSVFKNYL